MTSEVRLNHLFFCLFFYTSLETHIHTSKSHHRSVILLTSTLAFSAFVEDGEDILLFLGRKKKKNIV